MDDLISRQAAINAVNTALFPKINTAKDAEKALCGLPSVQPERKKGKWIRGDIKGIPFCCSVCTGRFNYEWNFCPNCGADMRGEHDE